MPAESGVDAQAAGIKIDVPISTPVREGSVSPSEIRNSILWRKEQPATRWESPDNEFNNHNSLILKPLKSVTILVDDKKAPPLGGQHPKTTISLDKQMEEEFAYYSRTQGMEAGTERTAKLQEIIDKMAEGTGIQTRVIILNKGTAPNAFVYPDGTIFVYQSALNQLDTMDEIAGALAHELGHLIHESTARSMQTKGISQEMGARWIHEAACDAGAPGLLEKAGFNSLAYASAIQKVSEDGRGLYHQSGLSRASQSVGTHFGINRTTSSLDQTPIPEILKKEARKTNVEIAQEQIQKGDIEGLKKTLPLLHPHDLRTVNGILIKERAIDKQHRWYVDKKNKRWNYYDLYSAANELISLRLEQEGYSKAEQALFLNCLIDYHQQIDARLITQPGLLYEMLDALPEFTSSGALKNMYQLIFQQEIGETVLKDKAPPVKLLDLMDETFYYENFEKNQIGIPANKELLLDCLDVISKTSLSEEGNSTKKRKINILLEKFLERTYLKMATEAKTILDPDQIDAFLSEVKSRGIDVSPEQLIHHFSSDVSLRINDQFENVLQENREIIIQSVRKIFDIKREVREFEFDFKDIDEYFSAIQSIISISEGNKYSGEKSKTEDFLKLARRFFDQNNIPDAERLKYIDYIAQKIDGLNYNLDYNLSEALESGENGVQHRVQDENTELNNKLAKLNFRFLTATALFQEDSPEFYQFINKSVGDSGVNLNDLSVVQLLNLSTGLFTSEAGRSYADMTLYGRNVWILRLDRFAQVKDYSSFFKSPTVEKILEKQEELHFTSIKQLNEWVSEKFNRVNLYRSDNKKGFIFQDSLPALILGKNIRDCILRLAEQDIQDGDLAHWYEFFSEHYPDSPDKTQFLRQLNKKYLESPSISLEEKTEYLLKQYDSVGPEGMSIVANQIDNLETFIWFREKMDTKFQDYLKGEGASFKLAAVDFVSSFFTRSFSNLLQTCQTDPKPTTSVNTRNADEWFRNVFAFATRSGNDFRYDRQTGRFKLNHHTRILFNSLTDMYSGLRNLSPLQRFAIAHKALQDEGGALSSDANRARLSKALTSALGFKKGFIHSVLEGACLKGDSKFIGFPASRILAPLLFRNLDTKWVDRKKLGKEYLQYESSKSANNRESTRIRELFTSEEIENLLGSGTRDLTLFGASYQEQVGTLAAELARDSDRQYFEFTRKFQKLLQKEEAATTSNEEAVSGIDPNTEAVIQGVESMGALGYRSLQLISQFKRFSPEIQRRLAESFDSNPGLNKLLFWENLYKYTQENPRIKEFVQKIRLGKYLGGGSLQTSYEAIYIHDGNEQKVALKMRNPNVEGLIEHARAIATEVLKYAGDKSKNRELAQIGMALVDLANSWCIADLNETNYEANDDLFKGVIANSNENNEGQFYSPDRIFTSRELKAEKLAEGRTVNQLLNDPNVSRIRKTEIVRNLIGFFAHQFKQRPLLDSDGKEYYLMHSDPHVGNYISGVEEGSSIAVIDRSMYLKISQDEKDMLQKLMVKGNDTEFVSSFIEGIISKQERGVNRKILVAKIWTSVTKEYISQKVKGKEDRIALLQTMMTEFSKAGVDVPLRIRLSIRNIAAFQELAYRYGVDFDQAYRQAA